MSKSVLAVFSDVHSNLEALQAVLADMDTQGISRRVCLGDTVGYAANPAQCLELVRGLRCSVVQGNHDLLAADDEPPIEMNPVARSGIEFSRRKLSPEQRAYLAGLPLSASRGNCQFVHASLDHPDWWTYIFDERDVRSHFAAQKKPFSFCGHTHYPGVWQSAGAGGIKSWRGIGRIQLASRGKVLVNVGSVGQPRDLNPAACYVICDPAARWVEFRRVEYDIAKAGRKISRAKLPRFLAQRLTQGE